MKIPPANPLTPGQSAEASRAVKRGWSSKDAARADEAGDAVEGAESPGRDFASVFEESVSRADVRDEGEAEGDRRVSRETERPGRGADARRSEERDGGPDDAGADGKGGGFEHRAALRELTPTAETTPARSILHVADLERIVSAVRAQLVEGGRHVVTVELRRSVLEGLKVRLSSDGAGRVTAEFIAASERVRSQLDARAPELAELLRGRGVNLAALRTGVETGAGGRGGEGGAREDLAQTAGATRPAAPDASSLVSNVTSEDAPAEDKEGGASNTYRA